MAAQLASGAVTKEATSYVPQYNIVRDISAFHRILL